MSINDVILFLTPIIAVYGAILSTYTIYQTWRSNKPKIKVAYFFDFVESNENGVDLYTISAMNIGNKPVTWAYFFIREYIPEEEKESSFFANIIHRKRYYSGMTTEWDTSINGRQTFSGQNISINLTCPEDFDPIITPENYGTIKKVVGIFIDQVGNCYKSEPFTIG
jgi:hypothetical protein